MCLCHARVSRVWFVTSHGLESKIRHSGGLLMGTGCPWLLWSPSRMSKWDPLIALTQGCCGPCRQVFQGTRASCSPHWFLLSHFLSFPLLLGYWHFQFPFSPVGLGPACKLGRPLGISAPVLVQATLQALLLGTKLLRSGVSSGAPVLSPCSLRTGCTPTH